MLQHHDMTLPSGIRLHAASAGEQGKPLMLLVHGFPECWAAWQAQLVAFGRDHFALAPDLRGYNLSDKPQGVAAYRVQPLMDDLLGLVQHFGYAQCVLVAHDWGGAVAWSLARNIRDGWQRTLFSA
ncbi:MAG: alpha/beta fold hydrolase [Thiomonas sp.]|uniref:Putative hydrolase n=1 Tax=mine drainage metagenome TaxID=410659 RepID=E6PRD7_9ZZZZ